MGEYTVYVHTSTIDGKRYVGTTKQAVERRWQRGAGYSGTFFGRAIKAQGWDSFTHEIVQTGLTKEEAYTLEIKLIAEYKTNNPDYGYNVSEGGCSFDLFVPKYGLDHPLHQRVRKIDPATGEVLAEYDSQSAAALANSISRKGITKACMGICVTYKGFIWEYIDKDYKKPEHHGAGNYDHKHQRKQIKVIFENGTEQIYASKTAACKALNVPQNSAWRYLTQGYEDPYSRRWCYA